MPLTPANLMASGYIVPSRFVSVDSSSTPVGAGGSTSNNAGFKCIQSTNGAVTVGISQVGTNYPPITDPAISVLAVAAQPGQQVQIFGQGASDVLLEMQSTCNAGDLLGAFGTNSNITLSTPGVLNDVNCGRGTTLNTTTNAGRQWYGARAIMPCTAAGEKIRVEIVEGYVTY